MSLPITLIVFSFLVLTCTRIKCSNTISNHCSKQTTCNDCLQANEECHWCYGSNNQTTNNNISKCGTLDDLKMCDHILRNSKSKILPNDVKKESLGSTVQLNQSSFNVNLRYKQPLNISFTYAPASNYPLDLYYLLDVSHSMINHLKIFQNLTLLLSERLKTMTQNYHVAYGSFMDKVGMPFYLMDQHSIKNPCLNMDEKCQPGYLFRHHLDFTNKMQDFTNAVYQTNITANTDNTDGALDAIMQVLTCDLGWNENSRKLLVVPTESLLHMAGDGILGGAVKKNEQCLLEENYYKENQHLIYDYPSLDEVMLKLRDKKVQLIFATESKELQSYYKNLSTDSPLKSYMSAIPFNKSNQLSTLEVIEESYRLITSQVEFQLTETEYLTAEFYNNCSGKLTKDKICKNVKIGESYEFVVELNLDKIPDTRHKIVFVEEKHLPNATIFINLTFHGYCKGPCENVIVKECQNGGEFECDQCVCVEPWKGDTCEIGCLTDYRNCRPVNSSLPICGGHGDCLCGKCKCNPEYSGKYCNYQCPYDWRTKKHCNGHGKCSDDRNGCECDETYSSKDNCKCANSKKGCSPNNEDNQNSKYCSGRGTCECNKCVCDFDFRGKFCQETPHSHNIKNCKKHRGSVIEFLESDQKPANINNISIEVISNKSDKRNYFKDNDRNIGECELAIEGCSLFYFYIENNNVISEIFFNSTTECAKLSPLTFKAGVSLIGTITLFTVLIGLAVLLVWRFRMKMKERQELKAFLESTAKSKFDDSINPLYKETNISYSNPMYRKNI